MARGRGGGRGAKAGRGHGRKKSEVTGLPSRSGEVGACVELGNNIFTLCVNSKSKDGDKLRKTSKAVANYIGRHFGDELQKEFEFGKKTVRTLPAYDAAVVARHAQKVTADTARLTAHIVSLEAHLITITTAIAADAGNLDLVTKKIEIEEKIAYSQDKLTDTIDIDKCMTGEEAKLWDSAHRSYREDEQKLIKDSGKVYALILGQCTQTLLEALQEDTDWDDISMKCDHIKLYKLIEKCVLKQTSSKYPYLTLIEEMRGLLNYVQGDQTPLGYYEGMSNRVSICEKAGMVFHTPELLEMETEVLHTGKKYDSLGSDEQGKIRTIVRDKFLGTLLLERSDKKHDQFKDDCRNRYSSGDKNAFPKTPGEAMQRMQDFRRIVIPEKTAVAQGTAFAGKGGKTSKKSGRMPPDEWFALSKEEQKKELARRAAERAKAAAAGKSSKKSTLKSKAKDDGDDDDAKSVASLTKELNQTKHMLKATQNCLVAVYEGEELTDDEEGSNSLLAELRLQQASPQLGAWYAQMKKSGRLEDLDLRNEYLLDSQTTHNLCCNKDFVYDIKVSRKTLNMSGNGGSLRVTREAKIRGLYPSSMKPAETWYDPDCITNLLSFKDIIGVFRVTYDSAIDTSFTVHRSEYGLVDLHFRMHESGLHILERPDGEVSGRVFLQTVEGNRKLYTKAQCARADKAGELYELLTYPGPRDFVSIVKQGRIRDCSVTADDVKRFFHIYGPHVMKGKGNAVRKVDKYEKNNIVAVPRELIKAQMDVTLCIDLFFVNKHVFLATYSLKICYTTTSHVSSKAVRHYWPYLQGVLQKYAARGFRVKVIRGDFEFNGIEKHLKLLPSPPENVWTSKDQHVGPIERNNRFIKEKARSIRSSLPYTQIPGIMIIHMILHASKVLNLFPRSGGIRDMSPNMIMSDEGVSMQQFRLLFGTYVQVKEPSTQTNSMQPRTRGAIALGTRGSSNDGQIFMALDTGVVIRRTHWTVHPLTDLVRKRVEELGSDEPRLLTWFDRHGREIGDGGMLWNSVQEATAETDRDTHTVLDDTEDADGVDNEDITGVDPHDEDVEESLDGNNQDFEDGDVSKQAIEEIREESEIREEWKFEKIRKL